MAVKKKSAIAKEEDKPRVYRTKVLGHNVRLEVTSFTGSPNIIGKSDLPTSNVEDPFEKIYQSDNLIVPRYNPYFMSQLMEQSDILKQTIESMQVNVGGFGYDLVRANWMDPNVDMPKGSDEEKRKLLTFLEHVNPDEDITSLRRRTREDIEATGYGGWEVIRNGAGEVSELYLLPAATFRITAKDKTWTKFDQPIRDYTGKFTTVPRQKKFRRFVQIIDSLAKRVYFKEFGDPRLIDSKTGEVGGNGKATEVILFTIPCNYSLYGMPRWIGTMISIFGSRKAEEVNFLFFDNKTIPPMVITVSGGALTQESIEKLKDVFEKEIKGVANFHKALILEATPVSVSAIEGEKVSPVRIQIQPLTQFIQSDATFREYRKDNRNSVRSSFRLPPIYVGLTDDYTRATAYESAKVAEEQVFSPERTREDYTINNTILASLQINFWDFVSLGGKTSDYVEVVRALAGVRDQTPVAITQEAVAKMLSRPIWPIDPNLYKTTPADLASQNAKILAETNAANKVDPARPPVNPNEQDRSGK